jgi:hypothetical protein
MVFFAPFELTTSESDEDPVHMRIEAKGLPFERVGKNCSPHSCADIRRPISSRLLRSFPMGRGSKSIRRWRKDRKRRKAEREKRKVAAADQRRGGSRQRSG